MDPCVVYSNFIKASYGAVLTKDEDPDGVISRNLLARDEGRQADCIVFDYIGLFIFQLLKLREENSDLSTSECFILAQSTTDELIRQSVPALWAAQLDIVTECKSALYHKAVTLGIGAWVDSLPTGKGSKRIKKTKGGKSQRDIR